MSLPVLAASGEGVIHVSPCCASEAVTGGTVTVYPVGIPIPGGYQLTDGLANWQIREGDVCTPEFALWIVEQRDLEGITQPINAGGTAVFENLEPGLYLITQQNPADLFLPFSPLVVILQDGQTQEVFPELEVDLDLIPQTGDHGAPVLWAIIAVLAVYGAFLLSDYLLRRK